MAELGGGAVTPAAQQIFLDVCLYHPLAQAYPVPEKLCRRAVKLLFSTAEADSQEVLDTLAEEVCSRVIQGSEQGWGHKTYAYLPEVESVLRGSKTRTEDKDHAKEARQLMRRAVAGATSSLTAPTGSRSCGLITLHLSDNMFEGSTGCHEWEAGFVMAEIILNNPTVFAGRHCLEIGCGAGVVGVCLGRVGAKSVTCTDGDMRTVENCRRNMVANNILPDEDRSSCQQLFWEEGWNGDQPDVVLGADLLYDPEVIPVLVRLLSSLLPQLQPGEDPYCCAYIATTLRNQSTVDSFVCAVYGAGLCAEDCTEEMQRERDISFQDCAILANRDSVKVHRIQRQASK